VYLNSDGRLIGLLVRGAPGGFGLIVPVRRMEEWAKKAKVEWAIRDDVSLPSEEDLDKLPMEDEPSSRSQNVGGRVRMLRPPRLSCRCRS
jgi:hypothetical protein